MGTGHYPINTLEYNNKKDPKYGAAGSLVEESQPQKQKLIIWI